MLLADLKFIGTGGQHGTATTIDPDSYAGKGIQVIVGHYIGNLPAERLSNLTRGYIIRLQWSDAVRTIRGFLSEDFNANSFNPIAGLGEGGHAVQLNTKDEIESERTFGINQASTISWY